MKLWQRYFLRKLALTFLFILFCLFAVFILVDLSVNGVKFFTRGQSLGLDILIYYGLQFAMRLDLFFPMAFLLATIKTLFDLNTHFELVALQTAGLSRKALLVPFLGFAMFLTVAGYANHEWIAPSAVKDINAFKRSKSRKLNRKKENIQAIPLDDGSELVYQTFDGTEFANVFWIRSPQDIWIMQSLTFSEEPVGKQAHHLMRTEAGLLEKIASFETHRFADMPTYFGIPGETIPFEGRSLSTLYRSLQLASAQTHFHRKLALPLLSLLALVVIAPFAMTFGRNKKVLPLIAFSVFGFVLFMTLYDSLIILGEHRMITPYIAMWFPIVVPFVLCGRRFWKLR